MNEFEDIYPMSESRMYKGIEAIKKYLNGFTDEFEVDKYIEDGACFYMNANDGTDFDWEMNDRTCEFMKFYNNEMGAIKLSVYRDGSLYGYKWSKEGLGEAEEINIEGFYSEEDAEAFAKALYYHFDRENKCDERV